METQKNRRRKKERNSREITSRKKKKRKNTENLIESDITRKSKNNCSKTLEGKGGKTKNRSLLASFGLVKDGFSNPEIRAKTKKAQKPPQKEFYSGNGQRKKMIQKSMKKEENSGYNSNDTDIDYELERTHESLNQIHTHRVRPQNQPQAHSQIILSLTQFSETKIMVNTKLTIEIDI